MTKPKPALTKAEKLARAMENFMSGGRTFDRALAAQIRDELRRLAEQESKIIAYIDNSEAHIRRISEQLTALQLEKLREGGPA